MCSSFWRQEKEGKCKYIQPNVSINVHSFHCREVGCERCLKYKFLETDYVLLQSILRQNNQLGDDSISYEIHTVR